MPYINVHVDDASYEALEADAGRTLQTVEERASEILRDAIGETLADDTMSWQAEDILKALLRFGARPNQSIPLQTVGQLWQNLGGVGRNGAELMLGLNELVDQGLVTTTSTAVALTERGYRR